MITHTMAIVQGPTVHRYNSITQGNNTIHGHCTNKIIWFKNLRVNNRQNLIRLLYIEAIVIDINT